MGALGPQFNPEQNEAIATALSIPVEERRLRQHTDRKIAAQQNATSWAIKTSTGFVRLSRDEYPDPMDAEQYAYLMATGKNNPHGAQGGRMRHVL